MSYKYFLTGSPTFFTNSKDNLINGFQSLLTDQFSNAPDVQTIQEEVTFGSNVYTDVTVRINRALNSITGLKLGDDYKLILFSNLTHATGLGYKYYFDSNYWIVTFSENIKNLAASCLVRRCNNVLRWVDDDGNYFTEPCVIDYEIARPRDSTGTVNPVLPQGYIDIYAQLNIRTRLIKANQRFLFGSAYNRLCFKIFGDGVKSFLNQQTMNDESGNLLQISLGGAYVNDATDDLVNGIADYNKTLYALSVTPASIIGDIGDTFQMFPVLTLNGNVVDKPFTYTISGSTVASLSGSGLVTLIGSGSGVLTCAMTSASMTKATVNITSSSVVITSYDIRVTPTSTYIFEGEIEPFTVYLYQNGTAQANAFVFTLHDANVPITNYNFVVTGANAFTVENLDRYLDYPLLIDCTSGSYVKQLSLEMRGSW